MRGLPLWGRVVLPAFGMRWKRKVEERAGLEVEQSVQVRFDRHDRGHGGALVREHGGGVQAAGSPRLGAVKVGIVLSKAMDVVFCESEVLMCRLPLRVVMVDERAHRRQHHDGNHRDEKKQTTECLGHRAYCTRAGNVLG